MNIHFCTIGTTQDVADLNATTNSIDIPMQTCNEFEFVSLIEKDVKTVIDSIDVHKSSSIEHLNSKLLKDAFTILIVQLTHLFNCSLGTNIFPSSWKLGKVIPIPKTKDRQYASNWRPISLLSLPGKLLEKLVHRQLLIFLHNNNLLSEMQHGFISGKSTSTALQDFILYATNHINNAKLCSCVFIDLSKAFDSLNHVVLLRKLRTFGLCDKAGPWFDSYLSHREQKTIFNGIESEYMDVISGVPQGSTLGPLLYILYVNDCFTNVCDESSKVLMYADDTVLLSYASGIDEALTSSQNIFDKYVKWATVNGLQINISKTKQMFINSRGKNSVSEQNIKRGNEIVSYTDKYTYLGVVVDRNLTFVPFLKSIIQRVNYKLYLFSKIRYLLTFSAALMVYKQMVLPFFDYLDILVDSGPNYYVDKLKNLQFRGIKIVYQYYIDGEKISNKDEERLHQKLGLEFLNKRRIKHLLYTMYGLKTRRPDLLDCKDKGIVLRSSTKIQFAYEKLNSDLYVKSPYIRGNHYWKQLSSDLQNIKTKTEFKRQLTDEVITELL